MEKETLRLSDIYRLMQIEQLAVAPDGGWVVMVVKENVKSQDETYQHLYLTPGGGGNKPHRLTWGKSQNRSPAWSLDGRYLAFLSQRPGHKLEEKPEKSKAKSRPTWQIWLFDLKWGGEPRQLTDVSEGVDEFSWAPDSRQLVFSSRQPTPEQAAYLRSVRGEEEGEKKGPFVLSRTQHKAEGTGFLDEVPTHLFRLDLETMHLDQLTRGGASEKSPRWSPNGSWIAFLSNRSGDEDNNRRTDLWLMTPDGEGVRRLTSGDMSIHHYAWSPDSRRIAFISPSPPEDAYALTVVWSIEVDKARELDEPLTTFIGRGWHDVGGRVSDRFQGDPAEHARVYPRPCMATGAVPWGRSWERPALGPLFWLDEGSLVTLIGDRGQTRLARFVCDGDSRVVFPADRMIAVKNFALSRDGSHLALVLSSPNQAEEVFHLKTKDLGTEEALSPDQLTDFNGAWLSHRLCAKYQRLEFPNSDGLTVEALVAFPPGWSEGDSPYPLVVKIHGGPMSYDQPDFRFDTQYLAARGYVVLLVNYRGSIFYGDDFCRSIKGDWGPREHEDIMSGVRAVLERGWADPQRLFCTGFSQGGIMTNWAVGHSHVFQAAVTEHGMWDYISAFGTDDCHLWWQDDLGMPWHNREQYFRMSPLSAVDNIQTPLLITAGEQDWRCPLTQAEQMYVALKKRRIATELVVYQEEGHAVSRPRRAIDRLIRICRWFERYGGTAFDDQSATGH